MNDFRFKLVICLSVVWPLGFHSFITGTIVLVSASFIGSSINIFLINNVTIFMGVFSGILGFITVHIYLKKKKNKILNEVVIDEFSGQLITTSVAGVSILSSEIVFILFRFFDILKSSFIKVAKYLKVPLVVMMDNWMDYRFSALLIFLLSALISDTNYLF